MSELTLLIDKTAVQPTNPKTQEVATVLLRHDGDEAAIKQLAGRITDGLQCDRYSDAATHSFVALIEALCANGEIVAVI